MARFWVPGDDRIERTIELVNEPRLLGRLVTVAKACTPWARAVATSDRFSGPALTVPWAPIVYQSQSISSRARAARAVSSEREVLVSQAVTRWWRPPCGAFSRPVNGAPSLWWRVARAAAASAISSSAATRTRMSSGRLRVGGLRVGGLRVGGSEAGSGGGARRRTGLRTGRRTGLRTGRRTGLRRGSGCGPAGGSGGVVCSGGDSMSGQCSSQADRGPGSSSPANHRTAAEVSVVRGQWANWPRCGPIVQGSGNTMCPARSRSAAETG